MAKRKLASIIASESKYQNSIFLRKTLVIFADAGTDGTPVITEQKNLLLLQGELNDGTLKDPSGLYEVHQAGRRILVLIKGEE